MSRSYRPIRSVLLLLATGLGVGSLSGCVAIQPATTCCSQCQMQSGAMPADPMPSDSMPAESVQPTRDEDPLTSLARSIDHLVMGTEDGPLSTGALGAPKHRTAAAPQRKTTVRQASVRQVAAEVEVPTLPPPMPEPTMAPEPVLPPEITGSVSDSAPAAETQRPAASEPAAAACPTCGDNCGPAGVGLGACGVGGCGIATLPQLPEMSHYLLPAEQAGPAGRFFPVPTRPVFSPQPMGWAEPILAE